MKTVTILDANAVLRLLLNDIEKQAAAVKEKMNLLAAKAQICGGVLNQTLRIKI
jgi:hypothetical protein